MNTPENPYYLGNCDCKPVILTAQTQDVTIKQELPWDANAETMMQAFYTIMVGMTFDPQMVLRAMVDFAEANSVETIN